MDNSTSNISLAHIETARSISYQTLSSSPLMEHPLLKEKLGLNVWLKRENHLPTGTSA